MDFAQALIIDPVEEVVLGNGHPAVCGRVGIEAGKLERCGMRAALSPLHAVAIIFAKDRRIIVIPPIRKAAIERGQKIEDLRSLHRFGRRDELDVGGKTGADFFDVVFDSVGGANMANSFQAAALNGQIATTVAMCELDLTVAHFKGLSLHVVFMLIPMLHNHRRSDHADILKSLARICEEGGLKPMLDEENFSLDQVGEAYARLESGKAMGKVVVEN